MYYWTWRTHGELWTEVLWILFYSVDWTLIFQEKIINNQCFREVEETYSPSEIDQHENIIWDEGSDYADQEPLVSPKRFVITHAHKFDIFAVFVLT